MLGWLLYLPFYIGFQSQLGGILPNLLFPTRFSQFFVMFGPFLVVAVFFLALRRRTSSRAAGVLRGFLVALPWTLLVPLLLLAAVALGLAVLPRGRPSAGGPGQPGGAGQRRLPTLAAWSGWWSRLRLATPWTYLILAG